MKKTITTEVELMPLMTPNFILTKKDGDPISISEFTDAELQEICAEFTENLIKKAHAKRTTTK